MIKFDLDKALAGAPVMLRNGDKAYICYKIPSERLGECQYALRGYMVDDEGQFSCAAAWNEQGMTAYEHRTYDILTMWVEPRPQVTITIPAPLKAPQEEMYYVECGLVFKSCYTEAEHIYDDDILESGLYFATKADAELFLLALQGARR